MECMYLMSRNCCTVVITLLLMALQHVLYFKVWLNKNVFPQLLIFHRGIQSGNESVKE